MHQHTLFTWLGGRISKAGKVAVALSLMTAAATAQTLTIGVTPGSLADSVEVAASEAREQGLDVRVIEFSDWATPNIALNAGDLDLNYFQHQAFLDNAVAETGFALTSIATGILPNLGLYSSRHASFDDLPEGGRVGVASDPVNQGRGLLLIEQAGLIRLGEGVGTRGTIDDVAENPKNLQFVEIEGPQLVRALDDVDLAQGFPAHYVNAGLNELAGQALLYSGAEDVYFAIRFVTREDNADDPLVRQFVELYQASDAVREQIDASFANNPRLYTLPWLEEGDDD